VSFAIDLLDESAPVPRATRLTLTCDGDHGLFPLSSSFEHPDGFMGQYALAMRAGWKDTSASGGRRFFCPECSGKVAA
jgi:hypothetical protein